MVISFLIVYPVLGMWHRLLLHRDALPYLPDPRHHGVHHLPVQEDQGRPEEVPGNFSPVLSLYQCSHFICRPARARITTAPSTRPHPYQQSTQTAHLTTQTTGL